MEWDSRGSPSGVYFYRLQAGDFISDEEVDSSQMKQARYAKTPCPRRGPLAGPRAPVSWTRLAAGVGA